jgi:hypothetical protein
MKNDNLIKKDSTEISIVLNRLAELMERTVTIYEETRTKALENHNYFRGMMEAQHDEDNMLSEDGILEKATNESLKLLIESAKVLEGPINTLTKVLTTKMTIDANKDLGIISKPININDFK